MPPFTEAPSLASLAGITHGFFGRRGGVSTGLYDSLNAGPGSDDAADAVTGNRARIAAALGIGTLQSAYQVHGTHVIAVEGARDERPEGDAMVTATPGTGLCILTADCVPVLFADPEAGLVGAAHAGWKGALAGVCEATVEAMVQRGAEAERIVVGIGPAIQQASYEVGPEFRERFIAEAPWSKRLFAPGAGDRFHFDLPGFVRDRLLRAGLTRIDLVADDTCAMDETYFSNRRRTHRGEADYGRNASVIALSAG